MAGSEFIQDVFISRRPWMAGSEFIHDVFISRRPWMAESELQLVFCRTAPHLRKALTKYMWRRSILR
jgi:hypothetical protein